jgi:RHS repeat-associated protein
LTGRLAIPTVDRSVAGVGGAGFDIEFAFLPDARGAVRWTRGYQPYGEFASASGATGADTRQFFHGKALDADSGLQYFGARFYDPALGRFMAMDPAPWNEANLHSFNRYAFANNNPLRFTDPDGREAEELPQKFGQKYLRSDPVAFQKSVDEMGDKMAASAKSAAVEGGQFVAVNAILGWGIGGAAKLFSWLRAAPVVSGSAESSRDLVRIADEIRLAGHPVSANMRTIVVGRDAEGRLYAATSSGRWDPGMRAEAERRGIACVRATGKCHAEENMLREAPQVKEIGTAKQAPCGPGRHDCRGQLDAAGVKVQNPKQD